MLRIFPMLAVLAFAVMATPARAQHVVPVQCPLGYVHQGEFCVGEGTRLPFAFFRRGGRWFGMRHFSHGRPVNDRPGRPGRPGGGRPGGFGGRH